MPKKKSKKIVKKKTVSKNLNKNLVSVFLLVILILVVGAKFGADYIYDQVMTEEVLPSAESGEGFTLYNGMRIEELPEQYSDYVGRIVLSLQPEDVFTGNLLVKNHFPVEKKMKLKVDEISRLDLETGEKEQLQMIYGGEIVANVETSKIPLIEFTKVLDFPVEGEGVEVFPYSLTIPEGVEEGHYEIIVQLLNDEDDAEVLVENGIVYNLAVGMKFLIYVGEETVDIDYLDIVSEVESISRARFIHYARYVAGSFLGLLTLFFLFSAYKK